MPKGQIRKLNPGGGNRDTKLIVKCEFQINNEYFFSIGISQILSFIFIC